MLIENLCRSVQGRCDKSWRLSYSLTEDQPRGLNDAGRIGTDDLGQLLSAGAVVKDRKHVDLWWVARGIRPLA